MICRSARCEAPGECRLGSPDVDDAWVRSGSADEDAVEAPRSVTTSTKGAVTVDAEGSNQLRLLVGVIPTDRLRFLTSDRRRAYSALLWLLLNHRRSHEIEVYYDDLLMEALTVVPTVEPGPYAPEAFRSDVKQLEDWGNLLRDAAERLAEALRIAQNIERDEKTPESAPAAEVASHADDLLRLSYLCLEVDRKIDDAARELAAFDAALVGFAVSPFRMEALAEVVDRLERYVEDYVAEATERARVLHRTARKLLQPTLASVLARSREHAEQRVRDDPFLGGSPGAVRDLRQILADLVPFFAPGGRFETLLERVHTSARDVVRRVHRHVENVRARNIRIETLRDRSREMARLRDDDLEAANAWVNGLFASAHLVTDLRGGTPEERSALPRPARRYETRRAA